MTIPLLGDGTQEGSLWIKLVTIPLPGEGNQEGSPWALVVHQPPGSQGAEDTFQEEEQNHRLG